MNAAPFIIPLFIPHTGCPHRCVFCNQNIITGTHRAFPSDRELTDSICAFLRHRGQKRAEVQIAFYGGNFLGLDPDQIHRVLRATESFFHSGQADSLRFSTRPDTVSEDRLRLLETYPVRTIELGAQSMDDRVLAAVHRGHTAGDTERAAARLKEKGFEVGLQVMVGLPEEDEASAVRTAERLAALNPDFVRIYPTLVLRDSRLAQCYLQGRYVPLSLEEAVRRAKNVYSILSQKQIPVVRMGLQVFNSEKNILAGPYHPAFGELVYSEIFFERTTAAIEKEQRIFGKLSVRVHPQSISKMRGFRNRNVRKLKERFGIDAIRVTPDPTLSESCIRIELNSP